MTAGLITNRRSRLNVTYLSLITSGSGRSGLNLTYLSVLFVAWFALNATQGLAQTKNPFLEVITCPAETLKENAEISIMVHLPSQYVYGDQTPFRFEIAQAGEMIQSGMMEHPDQELPLKVQLNPKFKDQSFLEINLEVLYCSTEPPKLCKFKSVKFIQPISIGSEGKSLLKLETQI